MTHTITIELTDFGWSRVTEEAARQGTSAAELIRHATAYYLADLDTGRVASRVLANLDPEPQPHSDLGVLAQIAPGLAADIAAAAVGELEPDGGTGTAGAAGASEPDPADRH